MWVRRNVDFVTIFLRRLRRRHLHHLKLVGRKSGDPIQDLVGAKSNCYNNSTWYCWINQIAESFRRKIPNALPDWGFTSGCGADEPFLDDNSSWALTIIMKSCSQRSLEGICRKSFHEMLCICGWQFRRQIFNIVAFLHFVIKRLYVCDVVVPVCVCLY